jgi:3-phosphoshikimate 1-carboxyvinyltransferase
VGVRGIHRQMLQGDTRFFEVLEAMGATIESRPEGVWVFPPPDGLRGLGEWDMTGYTDTFMTVAVLAVMAQGETQLKGLAHTRLQESDRVSAMAEALQRLGFDVRETAETLIIRPLSGEVTERPQGPVILRCHGDHRIAMSLGVLAVRWPGIVLDDPGCVRKTCPDFFDRLQALREAF